MRILIISDVHGNLPALEFVLQQEKEYDLLVSLGDVVNYGPWSNECVDLLEGLQNKILIRGNHEDAFIAGTYSGNHVIAKAFFEFCYPLFDRKQQIEKYVAIYSLANFDFVHTINDSYIFPDSDVELTKNMFIGHSHRLFIKEINHHTLVNAGSVGQNRVNPDEINYVIWEPETNNIQLRTKHFSADLLIREMQQRKYPQVCVDYIQSKRVQV